MGLIHVQNCGKIHHIKVKFCSRNPRLSPWICAADPWRIFLMERSFLCTGPYIASPALTSEVVSSLGNALWTKSLNCKIKHCCIIAQIVVVVVVIYLTDHCLDFMLDFHPLHIKQYSHHPQQTNILKIVRNWNIKVYYKVAYFFIFIVINLILKKPPLSSCCLSNTF